MGHSIASIVSSALQEPLELKIESATHPVILAVGHNLRRENFEAYLAAVCALLRSKLGR